MILFSKPGCPYCQKVKQFIESNNLQEFVTVDETYNVEEVVKQGGKRQFPMLLIHKCDQDNKDCEPLVVYESDNIMATLGKAFTDKVDEWEVPLVQAANRPDEISCEACQ